MGMFVTLEGFGKVSKFILVLFESHIIKVS